MMPKDTSTSTECSCAHGARCAGSKPVTPRDPKPLVTPLENDTRFAELLEAWGTLLRIGRINGHLSRATVALYAEGLLEAAARAGYSMESCETGAPMGLYKVELGAEALGPRLTIYGLSHDERA